MALAESFDPTARDRNLQVAVGFLRSLGWSDESISANDRCHARRLAALVADQRADAVSGYKREAEGGEEMLMRGRHAYDSLERRGYRYCDIPACNCNDFHPRIHDADQCYHKQGRQAERADVVADLEREALAVMAGGLMTDPASRADSLRYVAKRIKRGEHEEKGG